MCVFSHYCANAIAIVFSCSLGTYLYMHILTARVCHFLFTGKSMCRLNTAMLENTSENRTYTRIFRAKMRAKTSLYDPFHDVLDRILIVILYIAFNLTVNGYCTFSDKIRYCV